jgi:hypothetical protein
MSLVTVVVVLVVVGVLLWLINAYIPDAADHQEHPQRTQ